jgi:hypothetical protein
VRQLHLFEGINPASDSLSAGDATPDTPAPTATSRAADAPQMDLFGDRWRTASQVQEQLERFDLDAAWKAASPLVLRYPEDEALRKRANLIKRLSAALRAEKRRGVSPATALAALEPRVPPFLQVAWHRRLAVELENESGPTAELDGIPVGLHWLLASDLTKAEASFSQALASRPNDSRVRAYLADTLTLQGRRPLARIAYRDALASHPGQVDWDRVVDPDVRCLPDDVDWEKRPERRMQWAAALGVITGLFVPPPASVVSSSPPKMPRGLQFYHWLAREIGATTHDDRIACRRAMKGLCAELLQRFLERRG